MFLLFPSQRVTSSLSPEELLKYFSFSFLNLNVICLFPYLSVKIPYLGMCLLGIFWPGAAGL